MSEQLPEALIAIAGGGDMSTPEGFFQIETFSLMAPIAIMIVTIVIGARALAGEEANHTIGLLLANPIERSTVVLNQVVAMVLYAAVVGLATFAGVAVASIVSGLGMSIAGIAATSILVTLLGLLFGAFALLLSAATGQTRIAVYGTIGLALASHLLNSFLPLSARLAGYAKWTPNYYYLSSDPLINGMNWGHAVLLTVLIAIMLVASVLLFDRRDLRQQ
jgi:ABC-2 type transport system permease protein